MAEIIFNFTKNESNKFSMLNGTTKYTLLLDVNGETSNKYVKETIDLSSPDNRPLPLPKFNGVYRSEYIRQAIKHKNIIPIGVIINFFKDKYLKPENICLNDARLDIDGDLRRELINWFTFGYGNHFYIDNKESKKEINLVPLEDMILERIKYVERTNPSNLHIKRNGIPDNIKKELENVNIIGGISGIYAAIYNKAYNIKKEVGNDTFIIRGNFSSYGKGFSEEEAKISALMELVERDYSIVLNPEITNSFEMYSIDDLIEKNENFVLPSLFNNAITLTLKDDKIEWIHAKEIYNNKDVLLPAGAIYFLILPFNDYAFNPFFGETSGLAAGFSFNETMLHSLYELIERDVSNESTSISMRINLNSLPDKIKEIIGSLNSKGAITEINLHYNDLLPYLFSVDIKLQNNIFSGTGYDLNPERALIKALSEALLPYINKRMANIESSQNYSFNNTYGIAFNKLKNLSSGNVEDDINFIKDYLNKKEIPVYYYVVNNGENNIWVVKTASPVLSNSSLDKKSLRDVKMNNRILNKWQESLYHLISL